MKFSIRFSTNIDLHIELLSVSTFGAEKASNVDTYVVQFRVKMKDGSHMPMFTNVLIQITGNIQRGSLQRDIEFLQMIPQDKVADRVPHAFETATIDLLVGSDYFWHIISGDKIMLPSGTFMLSSKFGYIITGKCPKVKCDERDKGSCRMLVSTSLNQVTSDQALFLW